MLGIDNVKKIVSFAIVLGNEGGKDFEDGKISVAEALSSAVALSGQVVQFMKVDFSAAWPEISDIDPQEWNEISAMIQSGLDLPEDGLEAKIKGFFEASKTVYAAVFALIQIYKSFKKPSVAA